MKYKLWVCTSCNCTVTTPNIEGNDILRLIDKNLCPNCQLKDLPDSGKISDMPESTLRFIKLTDKCDGSDSPTRR